MNRLSEFLEYPGRVHAGVSGVTGVLGVSGPSREKKKPGLGFRLPLLFLPVSAAVTGHASADLRGIQL